MMASFVKITVVARNISRGERPHCIKSFVWWQRLAVK